MSGSIYQKLLEVYKDMGSAKRGKLLRIYLHIPSLPELRAIRASLGDLKGKLKHRNGTDTRLPRDQ